jgi:integrase
MSLKWADIGSDHIIIRDKLDEKTRTSMATKTKGSRRRVPIPISVIAEIEKLRPKNCSPDAYVFLNKRGRPFLASNLRRSWRKLRERLELPDTLKNKDLRHENASRLALAGIHPKNVQERLGQSSIRVTMDVYSHLMPGMDSEAVNVIDRMLKPTPVVAPVVAQPENADSGK